MTHCNIHALLDVLLGLEHRLQYSLLVLAPPTTAAQLSLSRQHLVTPNIKVFSVHPRHQYLEVMPLQVGILWWVAN